MADPHRRSLKRAVAKVGESSDEAQVAAAATDAACASASEEELEDAAERLAEWVHAADSEDEFRLRSAFVARVEARVSWTKDLSWATDELAGALAGRDLGPGLLIRGDLQLCREYPSALPAGLRLTGNLNISMSNLPLSLPEDLVVGEALSLTCVPVARLPAGLRVGGTLRLVSVSSLEQIDEDTFCNTARISQCDLLTSLPASLLCINGSVDVRLCPKLESLPDEINIGANLTLADCDALQQLPNLTSSAVGGNIEISNCSSLVHVSEEIDLQGSLTVSNCPSLERLAGSGTVSVGGVLKLHAVHKLGSIATSDLALGGNLIVTSASSLEQLCGGSLQCRQGNVEVKSCPRLVRLAGKDCVVESAGIAARDCESLREFAAGHLKALEIDAENLPALKTLASSVGDSNSLRLNLVGLEEIARSDSCHFSTESIEVFGATRLKSLRGVKVQSFCSLSNCLALTGLPELNKSMGDVFLDSVGCRDLGACEHVEANLVVINCEKFSQMVAPISVGGSLLICSCPAVKTMAIGSVGKDLVLEALQSLTSFSVQDVGGSLFLIGLPQLTELPSGLNLGGDLQVSACAKLANLNAVRLCGTLSLVDLNALANVNVGKVELDVELKGCPIRSLDGLGMVPGHLHIDSCPKLKKLPRDLEVGGTLQINNCAAFVELDDSLRVGMTCHLSHCPSLTHLPQSTRVVADVSLEGCSALKELPPGFADCCASLRLKNCGSLERLPMHMRVGGSLYISGCAKLRSLPSNITVENDLELYSCPAIEQGIRDAATVGGKLRVIAISAFAGEHAVVKVQRKAEFADCPLLQIVAGTLEVEEIAHVASCPMIRIVANSFRVGESLIASNLPGLIDLWDEWIETEAHDSFELVVKDCNQLSKLPRCGLTHVSLDMVRCAGIKTLPGATKFTNVAILECAGIKTLAEGGGKRVTIRHSASVSKCNSLESLGKIVVGEDASVERCHAFVAVGDTTEVGNRLKIIKCGTFATLGRIGAAESIEISDCNAFEAIGSEFPGIPGDLVLMRLPQLRRLETSLHVRSLTICATGLEVLPSGILVENDATLAGNAALTRLSGDLFVGGDLNLEDCTALESIPSAFLDWPPPLGQADFHTVSLGGSGIPEQGLEWLRSSEAANVRFRVNRRAVQTSRHGILLFEDLREACKYWCGVASKPVVEGVSVPKASLHGVLEFLSMLRGAKECAFEETHVGLAKRVVEVLQLLKAPPKEASSQASDVLDIDSRVEAIQRMEDSIDACHDKPVWALNQIELVGKIARARGDRSKLRKLGLGVMRLGIVHKAAQEKISQLTWVDDVCVYLRYEIELREPLGLPVSASKMIFPSYVDVSEAELLAVQDAALAVSEDEFSAWLEAWPEWQRQRRFEAAQVLSWDDLVRKAQRSADLQSSREGHNDENTDAAEGASARSSLRASLKRLSQRVGSRLSLRNMFGSRMEDPVKLRGSIWSLADLLRHWVPTGLDLVNVPLPIGELDDLEPVMDGVFRSRASSRASLSEARRSLTKAVATSASRLSLSSASGHRFSLPRRASSSQTTD